MTKQDIIEKLKELGIKSENCYPKNTFKKGDRIYVGMFPTELQDDFYFFSAFSKTLYHLPKQGNMEDYEIEVFQDRSKYLVPLEKARVLWEDKPFEELPDEQFTKITVRQYAAIHLKIPDSGLPWLDEMIRKAIPGPRQDTGPM